MSHIDPAKCCRFQVSANVARALAGAPHGHNLHKELTD
jgi:hypothetical protein